MQVSVYDFWRLPVPGNIYIEWTVSMNLWH
jgi:hypothetical protein